jgi:uncharacterized membrane protein YecN with MAPEG domain
MTKLEIAALYAGLNIILLLVLAIRVTLARRQQKVSFGDGGNPIVLRAMRAHGNAAEFVPAAIGALLFLALLDPVPAWVLQLLGGAFLLGRISHAFAITTYHGPPPGPGRAFGVLLTWASYLGFGVALIWGAAAATL